MPKIAFEIAGQPVPWYGLMAGIGYVIGMWTASGRGVRDGLDRWKVLGAGFWLVVGTFVGARVLHVAENWRERYAGRPLSELIAFEAGGLTFYGGFLAALAAGVLYIRLRKLPPLKFLDAIAPSLALCYALTRFGCFMNGCCYGRNCDLPWAVHYAPDHPTHGVPVHPAQLYSTALNLTLFAALAWLHRRKRFDGQIFAAWMIAYAVLRSALEFFRAHSPESYIAGFVTQTHLISVVVLGTGVGLYWMLVNKKRAEV